MNVSSTLGVKGKGKSDRLLATEEEKKNRSGLTTGGAVGRGRVVETSENDYSDGRKKFAGSWQVGCSLVVIASGTNGRFAGRALNGCKTANADREKGTIDVRT